MAEQIKISEVDHESHEKRKKARRRKIGFAAGIIAAFTAYTGVIAVADSSNSKEEPTEWTAGPYKAAKPKNAEITTTTEAVTFAEKRAVREAILPSDIKNVTYIHVNAAGQNNFLPEEETKALQEAINLMKFGTAGAFDPEFNNAGTIELPVDTASLDVGSVIGETQKMERLQAIDKQASQLIFGTETIPDGEIMVIDFGFPVSYGNAGATGNYLNGVVHLYKEGRTEAEAIKHEIGHVLGLGHSRAIPGQRDLQEGYTFIESDQDIRESKDSELYDYGDLSSTMGQGEADIDIFNGPHMAFLELLSDEDVKLVAPSEEPETVKIGALTAPDEVDSPRLIKIPAPFEHGSNPQYYYIELSGADAGYNLDTKKHETTDMSVKIFLAEDYSEPKETYYTTNLINLTSTPISYANLRAKGDMGADSSRVGQKVFADKRSGMSITLDSINPSEAEITITYDLAS